MGSHWVNGLPYYRCRFPAEYALANRVHHPINVYLREDQLMGEVNRWLAREFAPHRLNKTIAALAAAQHAEPTARPTTTRKPRSRSPSATASSPATVPRWTRAQALPRSSHGSPRRKQKRPDTWPSGARAAHGAGG